MNRIATSLIASSLLISVGLSAQEDNEDNLVPNWSFEKQVEGEDLRRYDEFNLAEGWYDPTSAMSELFATETRSRYVKIPDNMYGSEVPFDGDNYAGLHAYSYRARLPRTYIGVSLKKKLEDNGLYCIKFRASLAERSLYASNNLGVVLSTKKVEKKGETSIVRNDVLLTDKNDVVSTQDGWWEYCKKYNATGGERYLTIGNFSTDERTSYETMSVSSEFEKGPEAAAYYYIDAIEIREIQATENCGCGNTKIPESKVIYSSTVQIPADMPMGEKVEAIDAYFYQYKSELVGSAKRTVDQIIELMKVNPAMRVEITGHSDKEEVEFAKNESSLKTLALDRAKNTREYMAEKGIDRKRILYKSMDDKQPVSTMSTPLSLAKNRRVEFKIAL
ncbi:MAG: OmpA family protein [Flavobacteriales bacterium]|nr:OmpA family protein [Flavobacteriales bacterium]